MQVGERGAGPRTAPASLLFVYGTLRRGGRNDIARLLPLARWMADARVRGHLFDLGAYPALVLDPEADWVAGEVYVVPTEAWTVLDQLEEVVTPDRPNGEYFRVTARADDDSGNALNCQVYVANPAVMRLERPISTGDWLLHLQARRNAGPA